MKRALIVVCAVIYMMVASVPVSASAGPWHTAATARALASSSQVSQTPFELLASPLANPPGYCGDDIQGMHGFRDVDKHAQYCFSVRYLIDVGALEGYPCGGVNEPCDEWNRPYFRPNAKVSRGQFSKILTQVFDAVYDCPMGPCPQHFQDIPWGHTFYPYVEGAVQHNWIQGYPWGQLVTEPCVPPANLPYFRSAANVTRQQISKFNVNAAGWLGDQNVLPSGRQTYSDVAIGSTFYYYVEILQ